VRFNELCTRFYRTALFVGCSILFFQQTTGFYFLQAVTLSRSAKELEGPAILSCSIFGVSFIGLLYLNRTRPDISVGGSRKSFLLVGLYLTLVCNIMKTVIDGLILSLFQNSGSDNAPWMRPLLMTADIISILSCVLLYGPIW